MAVVVMDGMGLVVSAETRVRLQRAALWVEERGGLQEVLVVAPSRGAADDFVRGLAQKKGGAWGVHRMTLAQLASIYATERLAEEQRAPLSPLGVEALAARAVHDCRAQEPLEYFHPVADMPGFARALARTLTELRLDEASPEKLAGSGHPGSDLARLLTCYEAELEARKLADFASMLKVAAESEQGRRYETFSFGRMPTLLLDVSLTSKLEKRFLARHCQHSRQIFATALRSDEETREALQEVLGCRAVDLEADGWKAAARGKGEEIPGGQGDGGGSFSQGFGQPGLPGPDDGSQGLAQERGDKGPQKDAGEDAERASSKPSAERDEDSDGEAESWPRQDESQEPPGRDELDSVRRWIFSPGDIPEPREQAGTVEFFSAPGEGRECVEVARRILIASSQGVPFDQMAILLRDPGIYLPLIEDALRRARIPAYFTQGAIRPDPAGRAFLALLACAAEGLSASRFAEYLSLGQVPEVDEGGGPPQREAPWVPPQQGQLSFITAEPGAIESSPEQTSPPAQAALFQLSGPGSSQGDPPDTEGSRSPSQDASRSDSRAAFSRTGSADAGRGAGAPSSASHHRTQPSDVDSSPVIAGGLRTPFQWEKLLTDAAVIGGDWKRWQRRLSGLAAEMEKRRQSLLGEDDTHAQHLSLQLERLEVLRRFALPLVRHLSELPAEAKWGVWLDYLRRLASESLAAPEAVLGVLGELQPMDEVGPVDLSEVRQVLSERLTTLRVEPPQRRYGKVFVGTVEEAAARSFRWTFIPGLAEGAFPRKALEDPLLLDDYRQSVSSDLELLPDRFERERLLLRVALGAAGDKLLISYPRMDAVQGRPRVPSFYALDVLRAAQGRLPDLKKLEQQAALAVKTYLGWPAPKDPMDAIDDAEHDLSVLETLMQDKQPSVGGARYLVEVSPHLARSLRYRYMRWSIPRWTEADGVYRPDQETARLLESQSLRRRSFSPTALQHFAACPYRFLLSAIHRLRPRDEMAALEQIDPLTRGSLFHDTQFRLFQSLKKDGLLPMSEANRQEVLDRADQVLEETAEQYREELAPAIPRVWAAEIEDVRTDLRGWIRTVIQENADWKPVHFEFAFGLKDRQLADAASTPKPARVLDGYRIRGSIDLVEQSSFTGALRVIDHKTGRPPFPLPRQVGGGEHLQPVLYALAAEDVLERDVDAGHLFYCTQRGGYRSLVISLDDEARARMRQTLQTVEREIDNGFLCAAPRPDACKFCDFVPVCGPYEEQRAGRKIQQPLKRLEELRRLP